MSTKQINIDKLNEHLFETIEMLKANNDPNASQNEKIDVDTAKAIAELGKVAIEGYKVKVQAMGIMAKSMNPTQTIEQTKQMGFLTE